MKNFTPGSLQKITHRPPKKEWNGEKKPWNKNENGEFKKKEEKHSYKNDPLIAKKMNEPPKMINEINIYIKDKSPLKDLAIILNNSKNINAKEFTKVYFHITDDGGKETKIDLGQGYQVFDIEKKRIIETHGVIKVE